MVVAGRAGDGKPPRSPGNNEQGLCRRSEVEADRSCALVFGFVGDRMNECLGNLIFLLIYDIEHLFSPVSLKIKKTKTKASMTYHNIVTTAYGVGWVLDSIRDVTSNHCVVHKLM